MSVTRPALTCGHAECVTGLPCSRFSSSPLNWRDSARQSRHSCVSFDKPRGSVSLYKGKHRAIVPTYACRDFPWAIVRFDNGLPIFEDAAQTEQDAYSAIFDAMRKPLGLGEVFRMVEFGTADYFALATLANQSPVVNDAPIVTV